MKTLVKHLGSAGVLALLAVALLGTATVAQAGDPSLVISKEVLIEGGKNAPNGPYIAGQDATSTIIWTVTVTNDTGVSLNTLELCDFVTFSEEENQGVAYELADASPSSGSVVVGDPNCNDELFDFYWDGDFTGDGPPADTIDLRWELDLPAGDSETLVIEMTVASNGIEQTIANYVGFANVANVVTLGGDVVQVGDFFNFPGPIPSLCDIFPPACGDDDDDDDDDATGGIEEIICAILGCLDPADVQADDSASINVIRESALSINKEPEGGSHVAGTTKNYTITVKNDGPSDADKVIVIDTLPNSDYSSYDGYTGNAISSCVDGDPGTKVCKYANDIPAGQSASFTFKVDVDPDAPEEADCLVNTAEVDLDDGAMTEDVGGSPNTDTVTTACEWQADLRVLKTATPGPLASDNDPTTPEITYVITTKNLGPSVAKNPVTIDKVPFFGNPGSRVVNFGSDPANACQESPNNTITCNWGPKLTDGLLPVDGVGTLTIKASVPAGDAALGTWTNTAAANSATPDPTPGNNSASDDTQVVAATPTVGLASLTVQKYFTDGNNETPVTLRVQCTNGVPNQDQVTVLPDMNGLRKYGMYEVTFVIQDIVEVNGKGATCTVTEDAIAGYDTEYFCDQDDSMSDVGDTCHGPGTGQPDPEDSTACKWTDIRAGFGRGLIQGTVTDDDDDDDDFGPFGDSNYCLVLNTPTPVDVTVTKDWIVTYAGGDEEDLDQTVTIKLFCDSGQIVGDDHETLTNGDYEGGSADVVFEVIPDFPETECYATESFANSYVEMESTCGTSSNPGLELEVGVGDECTFTNTVFFEGIPTLSQWGMAIMALLMLGVGFIGVRRFV